MPLTLVTGPANSAKAGAVLGDFRARLDQDPVLVVPAFADVEHSQREMAREGAVFGARVVRFAWLFDEIAKRAGYRAERASDVQRELIVEAAVRGAHLRVLERSAARPGFVRAAAGFVSELGRAGVDPARFTQALRDWQGGGPRAAYASEISAVFSRYRAGLDAAGLVDPELYAWRALDALRAAPSSWGRAPVFVYGFDDFTELELDAIETLAVHAGAHVTVSLPYERGREAFRAVSGAFQRLETLAGEHVELGGTDEHYADGSRRALAHVERALFETGHAGVDPGEAVRVHLAGGRRAEVELVAAEVLKLLRAGTAAGDVAVVFRNPDDYSSVVEQVFEAYGITYSIDRWAPVPHTALGHGLLALMRAAGPGGTADDLLAWLRTPGKLTQPQLADRLEAEVRQAGARSAREARAIWEDELDRWRLEELDRLAAVAGDPVAYLDALERESERLFAAPYRRRAHVLAEEELDDARVYSAVRGALGDVRRALAGGVATGLDLDALHAILERLRVRLGAMPQPDRVQVAAPEAIRARRFEAVFVCGLQEGEFPRRAKPEPFLPDDDRRDIAKATGLVLPVREDQLERERYLFYVAASRAERLLVLSFRASDEEGGPEPRSFFVDDLLDLFEGEPACLRRSLSDVTWAPEEAPTREEWERAIAALGPRSTPPAPDGLRDEATIAELAGEWTFSASALEAFADCPVKWLVERRLRPNALEPDPEHMVRGSYAHDVLRLTFSRLFEATGSRRVTPANLADAERILLETLAERQREFRLSPDQIRVRTAVRRLEFDLLRLLRREAESDSVFEPAELEVDFGSGEEGALRAAGLGLEGVSIRGRIDRVDTWGDWALVRDYKSGSSGYPSKRWKDDRRLQVAVYLLALRELRELRPAGGVYQPLSGSDPKPRGALLEDLREELGSGWTKTDWRSAEELEQHLDDARETVRGVIEKLREGRVRPCPDTCAWNGGCSYPAICREEGERGVHG